MDLATVPALVPALEGGAVQLPLLCLYKYNLPSLGAIVNRLPERLDEPVGCHFPHEQMMGNLLLSLLIFVVSVISGMLGIGVAFADTTPKGVRHRNGL